MLLGLRRKPRYDGFLITVFGAWYGCQRILEDFLREDRHLLPGLTGSQITSIIVVLLCLWHLLFVRHTPRWGRWDERRLETEESAESDEPEQPDEAQEPQEPHGEGTPQLPTSVIHESPENEE